MVPERRPRGDLHGTLSTAVPLGDRGGLPHDARILGHDCEVGQALALEAGSPHLSLFAWRGLVVEGSGPGAGGAPRGKGFGGGGAGPQRGCPPCRGWPRPRTPF